MASSDTTEEKERHVWLSHYAPLLLWIAVIFFLSSSQGSFSETSRIIRPILEFFFPTALPETIAFYHGVIRKFAHFTEYAVLGLLAFRGFALSNRFPLVLAIGLSALVATVDESMQSLNPKRTGSPVDVAIDLAGSVTGVILATRIHRRHRTKRRLSVDLS